MSVQATSRVVPDCRRQATTHRRRFQQTSVCGRHDTRATAAFGGLQINSGTQEEIRARIPDRSRIAHLERPFKSWPLPRPKFEGSGASLRVWGSDVHGCGVFMTVTPGDRQNYLAVRFTRARLRDPHVQQADCSSKKCCRRDAASLAPKLGLR